ncbi:hypothetical protein AAC387_Pa10g2168 [Persea americana]
MDNHLLLSSQSNSTQDDEIQPSPPPGPPLSAQRPFLHRSRTAPALSAMPLGLSGPPHLHKPHSSNSSLLSQSLLLLLIYLIVGVIIYYFNRHHFSGAETHPIVDALYFSIVTLCTIGYGDIAPLSPFSKAFACIFVLFGFGFLDIALSAVINLVLDEQENTILAGIQAAGTGDNLFAKNYIIDVEKGRVRIRTKVGFALGVVVLCVGAGALVLFFVERFGWIDSFYLSVMSVTTVGYGDKAFRTMGGRLFAVIWLLLSTLAVARAFLTLAEARIDKRHRRIAKWILNREITVEDLLAADINNNGFVSKSEYVLFKLKELGKIAERDVLQICVQFSKLDPYNSGKITLLDVLQSHS